MEKKKDSDGDFAADASMKIASNKSTESIFKERLVSYRKQLSKNMVFADQLDLRDPQMVSEFACDIYTNMKKIEKENFINPDYLSTVQI